MIIESDVREVVEGHDVVFDVDAEIAAIEFFLSELQDRIEKEES